MAVQVVSGDPAAELAEFDDLYVRSVSLTVLLSDFFMDSFLFIMVVRHADLYPLVCRYTNAEKWDGTRNYLLHNK